MHKAQILSALNDISRIEDLYKQASDLFEALPLEIQDAVRNYHTHQGNLEYCTRWGYQAAKECREYWHDLVSKLEVVSE